MAIQRGRYQGLYRSRRGIIAGVLKGIADYFDLKVFWFRVIMIVLLLATGFFPLVLIYLVAMLIMKPEPERQVEREY